MLCNLSRIGKLDLKEETVENLLSAASLLQLRDVADACSSFLMKQLHPSNCIGIRQFAEARGCTDLYRVANSFALVSRMLVDSRQIW